MEEEIPGWIQHARTPGTRKRFLGLDASDGLARIHEDDQMIVFAIAVDGGRSSWRNLKKACEEGTPIAMTLSTMREAPESAFLGHAKSIFLKLLS